MPPGVLATSSQPMQPHHNDIVDEESLHLLVANISSGDYKPQHRYCSFDDTLSTSIISSSCDGELSDEDIPTTPTEANAPSLCYTKLWNAYSNKLEEYPLLVKSITALILMLLADLLAQGVENLRGISLQRHHDGADAVILLPVNWLRTLRFGVFGVLGAPWTHYYYYWLDTILPPTQYPWTWTTFGPFCSFVQSLQFDVLAV
jgi:hypothetical protein